MNNALRLGAKLDDRRVGLIEIAEIERSDLQHEKVMAPNALPGPSSAEAREEAALTTLSPLVTD